MTTANNLRNELLNNWADKFLKKDITSNTSMQKLHLTYSKYCESQGSIPYRRKFFAYLLKKYLFQGILASEILIYHKNEVWIKGIKINSDKNSINEQIRK